jgi:putative chitinase
MVTKEQLRAIYKGCSEERIDRFLGHIQDTMAIYNINTPQRIRMFLAQIGHESGQLRYVEEIASGAAYEGRKDLGNTAKGDGVKFKGRGLIQITGKNNYIMCGFDLDLPLWDSPEMLAEPKWAARSAGWFWNEHSLNKLCDANLFQDLTKCINGGLNGYPDRYKLLQRAIEVIPLEE